MKSADCSWNELRKRESPEKTYNITTLPTIIIDLLEVSSFEFGTSVRKNACLTAHMPEK